MTSHRVSLRVLVCVAERDGNERDTGLVSERTIEKKKGDALSYPQRPALLLELSVDGCSTGDRASHLLQRAASKFVAIPR